MYRNGTRSDRPINISDYPAGKRFTQRVRRQKRGRQQAAQVNGLV